MKASDIYEMGVVKTVTHPPEFGGSFRGFLFPSLDNQDLWDIAEAKNLKVVEKVHVFYCPDGRRTWRLSSMWFSGAPFMVIQTAGREGGDWQKAYVTDDVLYKSAVIYLHSLIPIDLDIDHKIINQDEDVGDLYTCFYGHDIEDIEAGSPQLS